MAKLVVHIPAQRYEFELSEENEKYLREAWEDDDDWAWEDATDNWVSDVNVRMESEFVE
jgi:hypothetical protein